MERRISGVTGLPLKRDRDQVDGGFWLFDGLGIEVRWIGYSVSPYMSSLECANF